MIEAYAFLAMFTAQILAMSVLHPTWFIRYLRVKINPAERERDPQVYIERRLTQYRALNTGIAVLGVLLLGWFFSYTRRLDWSDGPIEGLLAVYFMVQWLPLCLVAGVVARINKTLTRSVPKRKAVLQRRGVFDFISPTIICLAILVYFLFGAFMFYIEQDPFPAFAGALTNIGFVTLLYAMMALGVYMTLYFTKSSPLETHAERMHAIGLGVKIAVYTCIGSIVALALNMTLIVLDLQRWEPFAQSVFYVILSLAFTYSRRPNAPPRHPEADESPVVMR